MTKNNAKKYFKTGVAAAVVVSSGVAVAPMATEASQTTQAISFSDLNKDDLFYKDIMNLTERGIIVGYPNGKYGAKDQVTRGQAAKILAKILNLDTVNVTDPGFTDVPKNHPYYGSIAALQNAGIVTGYNNTFFSNEPVTRNQMAIMISNGFGFKASEDAPFIDMDDRYKGYISALFENNITKGKTPTVFDGKALVTRGQIAAFSVRADSIEREATFTINDVTDSKVVTATGEFKTSLPIFNANNVSALENAEVIATIANGEIIAINSITLNTSGSQESPVIFDAGNTTINGSLQVNADYVNVKNMTVKEDVIVTGKVSNDFSAEGLITNGELIIEESNSSVASMNIMASAIETESKVNLTNSQVNAINAKRNNVTITANTKLSQVKVGSNVASIKMNAEVEAVTVNTTGNLQVTGTGSIDKVMVENATQLTLDVAGQVKELNVANNASKVTLGDQATVEKLVIPTGSDVSKLIENYENVKENIADVVDEAGTEIAPNYVNVTTLTELKEALANEQYTSINLKGNIEDVSERIIVDRAITINGNGHSIKFTDEINKLAYGSRHGMLVTADDVKINNLTVALTEAANWQGAYGVQVYDAQNVQLNNFTGTNADAAILVNGSTVELIGKTVVSGNEFGGIEVSKGSAITNEAKLKVTGTIENTTEQHGEPTIWVVNGQGSIEGNIPTTVNTTIKADQTQYYVSQAAEATMNVNSINELKAALANTAIKTINLKENLSNISERIIVDREVEINGNGHTISFTNEINELAYGSRHGILLLSDNVKINDITVTLTEAANWQGAYAVQVYDAKNVVLKNFTGSAADAALLVNASDVELTGTTTVSGNEFGGIEVSKGSLAGLENSLLTVTGSLANTTEETGKPTIWVVKDQGIVAGVNVPTTVDTEIKADQVQYYLSK